MELHWSRMWYGLHVGPCCVAWAARTLRRAGFLVEEGTERVYFDVPRNREDPHRAKDIAMAGRALREGTWQ